MKQPEIVELLVRKDDRIANLEAENHNLRRALESIVDKVDRMLNACAESQARGNIRALEEIKQWIENCTPRGRNLDSRNS